MTFQEAHDLMDLLLDKADQAYYTTAEKDKFLSMAIMEWFKELVDEGSDTTAQNELARFIVSREDDFDNTDGYINVNNNTIDSTSPLPVDHTDDLVAPLYKILKLRVKTSGGSWEDAIPFSAGQYSNDVDPFNKPQAGARRWRQRDNKVEVIPNTSLDTNADYSITFVTYPNLSNVETGNFSTTTLKYGTADLPLGSRVPTQIADSGTFWSITLGQDATGAGPDECHDIVKRAVRMMTANIESPLYQVNAIEQHKSGK